MTMNREKEHGRRKWLLEDLKEHVMCPVCLEVPRSGPIYACPNGHHVCKKCKQKDCPICRAVMGSNKSLLAVEIIENILHKCKFVKCEDMFHLGYELFAHERNCEHRIVSCLESDCDEKFALSDLREHRGRKSSCSGIENIRVEYEANVTVIEDFCIGEIVELKNKETSWPVHWYTFYNSPVALCVNKSTEHYHFYIVLVESEGVCEEQTVELEVFKKDSPPQVSRNCLKFRGNPVSIDTPKSEIENLGLTVHHEVMEKMVLEEDAFNFTVSFSFVLDEDDEA